MPAFDYSTDFIAKPLYQSLAGFKSKRGNGGSININCPICTSRAQSGFRPDTKNRCGVWISPSRIGVKCFNCAFKTRFDVGGYLGNNLKVFLQSVGIDENEVKKLALQAATIHRMIEENPDTKSLVPTINNDFFQFTPHPLPAKARPLEDWANDGCEDPEFLEVCSYLLSRGEYVSSASTYYWTPEISGKQELNKRLIVPYLHDGKVIGWTGRSYTEALTPKYMNDFPQGMLFNTQAITKENRKYLIVVEGIFDAIALDALGKGGNVISSQQVQWINMGGKDVIVLPDRDRAGKELIDIAVYNDWSVAFPRLRNGAGRDSWWDDDIKDAADAVKRYGRLYTLKSVIETATNSKIKIQQLKKLW